MADIITANILQALQQQCTRAIHSMNYWLISHTINVPATPQRVSRCSPLHAFIYILPRTLMLSRLTVLNQYNQRNSKLSCSGLNLIFNQACEGNISKFVCIPPSVPTAQAALGGGLQSALRSGNAAATQHVLHAYAAIGDHGGAETGVRTELVAPAVARVLEAQKSNGPGGVTDVLAKVRDFILCAGTRSTRS